MAKSATGKMTTHVLDIMHGHPAAGMTIELWRLNGEAREHLLTVQTNSDGRVSTPLRADDALIAGEYELLFHVRAYFETRQPDSGASPFLNIVPIRFTVFDASQHYHVPLLVSPWAYSTYRGS
jgi:5-hydroxyisourate hydrolase